MTTEDKELQREAMRTAYAVHYSEINGEEPAAEEEEPEVEEPPAKEPNTDEPPEDDGEPMPWE